MVHVYRTNSFTISKKHKTLFKASPQKVFTTLVSNLGLHGFFSHIAKNIFMRYNLHCFLDDICQTCHSFIASNDDRHLFYSYPRASVLSDVVQKCEYCKFPSCSIFCRNKISTCFKMRKYLIIKLTKLPLTISLTSNITEKGYS